MWYSGELLGYSIFLQKIKIDLRVTCTVKIVVLICFVCGKFSRIFNIHHWYSCLFAPKPIVQTAQTLSCERWERYNHNEAVSWYASGDGAATWTREQQGPFQSGFLSLAPVCPGTWHRLWFHIIYFFTVMLAIIKKRPRSLLVIYLWKSSYCCTDLVRELPLKTIMIFFEKEEMKNQLSQMFTLEANGLISCKCCNWQSRKQPVCHTDHKNDSSVCFPTFCSLDIGVVFGWEALSYPFQSFDIYSASHLINFWLICQLH